MGSLEMVWVVVVIVAALIAVPVVVTNVVPRVVRTVVPSVLRALKREGLLEQTWGGGEDARLEMEQLRDRVAELEERSDFLERALADQRREALPPRIDRDA